MMNNVPRNVNYLNKYYGPYIRIALLVLIALITGIVSSFIYLARSMAKCCNFNRTYIKVVALGQGASHL